MIAAIDKKQDLLDEIKPVISALGATHSPVAQDYLHNLLQTRAAAGDDISHVVTLALSQQADADIFKNVFNVYSRNKSRFLDTYAVELTLNNSTRENENILQEISGEADAKSKIAFLQALQALRTTSNQAYSDRAKELLNDDDETVRAAAVKTLHFLLPYEKEKELFNKHLGQESAKIVMNQIYQFIGRK